MATETIVYANIEGPWTVRAKLSLILLRYCVVILNPWHDGGALLIQARTKDT